MTISIVGFGFRVLARVQHTTLVVISDAFFSCMSLRYHNSFNLGPNPFFFHNVIMIRLEKELYGIAIRLRVAQPLESRGKIVMSLVFAMENPNRIFFQRFFGNKILNEPTNLG